MTSIHTNTGSDRQLHGNSGVGDAGQATTEYALILLGAALVGLIVVAWATSGGSSGRIGRLFDAVVDSVISRL